MYLGQNSNSSHFWHSDHLDIKSLEYDGRRNGRPAVKKQCHNVMYEGLLRANDWIPPFEADVLVADTATSVNRLAGPS